MIQSRFSKLVQRPSAYPGSKKKKICSPHSQQRKLTHCEHLVPLLFLLLLLSSLALFHERSTYRYKPAIPPGTGQFLKCCQSITGMDWTRHESCFVLPPLSPREFFSPLLSRESLLPSNKRWAEADKLSSFFSSSPSLSFFLLFSSFAPLLVRVPIPAWTSTNRLCRLV